MQCSFTKLSGSDFTITFELYNVSTEGLIDKFTETAKNFNGLRTIMEKKIPDGFMKIPGAAPPPQAETTPLSVDGGITSGILADSRDGKKYKTAKIGNQTWMAENLNYATSDSKCYDNKPENCAKYGRLYNWYAAMNACPSGWHLPSNGEYETLDKYVGGEKVAGKKLKTKNGWYNNGNGTDDYGFSALPGSHGSSSGSFNSVGLIGVWWSATEGSASRTYYRFMYYGDSSVSRDYYDRSDLYSVRCVQD